MRFAFLLFARLVDSKHIHRIRTMEYMRSGCVYTIQSYREYVVQRSLLRLQLLTHYKCEYQAIVCMNRSFHVIKSFILTDSRWH